MVKQKLSRKKAAAAIIGIATVLAWMVVTVAAGNNPFSGVSIDSQEDCAEFLAELGWETNPQEAVVQTTILPERFDNVYTQYNQLQIMQGSDLTRYAGKEVTVFTLPIINYASTGDHIYATVITYKGRVIGGDIHSAEMGGFMHALK